MKFDIITIFPEIFDSYLKETLISRALKKKLIEVEIHNLREWTKDERKTVDDRPFGGGLGMVMKVDPILKSVIEVRKEDLKSKVIAFTPRGKKLNQRTVHRLSKMEQLIMICGRYEGIDERVSKHIVDEEISIGDYILMGGELPAMVSIEAISRLVPGVVGKEKFLSEKIKKNKRKIEGMIEYPQYTRPEVFNLKDSVDKNFVNKYKNVFLKKKKLKDIVNSKWKVPKELTLGDHKKIEEWRKKEGKTIWN